MTKHVYIGNFIYRVGEKCCDVGTLNKYEESPINIENFCNVGLKNFRVTEDPFMEFVTKALEDYFSTYQTEKSCIDAIILCTSSHWCYDQFTEAKISNFLFRNGLDKVVPIGISYSFCGNFLAGIRAAYNHVVVGDFDNVLLVVADKIKPNVTRIVPPDVSIGSDAVSCCLVSSSNISNLLLDGINQNSDSVVGLLDPKVDFIKYTQGVAKGIRTTVSRTLHKANLSITDITDVIPNNYNRLVTPNMVRLLGLKAHEICIYNIGEIGHGGAADIGINLTEFFKYNNVKNKNILLLSTGPSMWGSAIVKSFDKN